MLGLIAFRKNGRKYPSLGPGIEFFSMLCKFTADGFFTSEIGIRYLGYVGNTYRKESRLPRGTGSLECGCRSDF